MIGDSNFLDAYIPTHMHFGNTLIGILGGIIYYQLRQQKFNAKENKVGMQLDRRHSHSN